MLCVHSMTSTEPFFCGISWWLLKSRIIQWCILTYSPSISLKIPCECYDRSRVFSSRSCCKDEEDTKDNTNPKVAPMQTQVKPCKTGKGKVKWATGERGDMGEKRGAGGRGVWKGKAKAVMEQPLAGARGVHMDMLLRFILISSKNANCICTRKNDIRSPKSSEYHKVLMWIHSLAWCIAL